MRLADFAAQEQIDLTVVGPEEPLTLGIADEFATRGLDLFGPSQAAAQLESSKAFAKQIMQEAGCRPRPLPCSTISSRRAPISAVSGGPMVVKADGLAAGKGVTVATTTQRAPSR